MKKTRMTSNERREQIIKCARKVFAKYGLDAAKVKIIAEECGINEAVIYKHFKGKKELFFTVLNDIHDDIRTLARGSVQSDISSMDNLIIIVKSLWAGIGLNKEIGAIYLQVLSVAIRDENVNKLVTDRFKGHFDYLVELLEMGKKDGSIRKDIDAMQIAGVILSLGLASVINYTLGLDEVYGKIDTIEHFELLFDAIKNKK